MTIDTSTEAVEDAATVMDTTSGHHSVAALLRALAAERDGLARLLEHERRKRTNP